MKFIHTATASILAALAFATPGQAAPASIAGDWKTNDGRAIVTFAKCGNAMCGRITRFLVPEPAGGARDTENPKKDLRGRKLMNTRIFWGLTPDRNSFDGKGYSPEDGQYFNADVRRSGNQLKIKGCVLLFCKTVNFTKA
ncbi:MAG: DUF2147 domain-containing protein [Pontixanthobacter sp.]